MYVCMVVCLYTLNVGVALSIFCILYLLSQLLGVSEFTLRPQIRTEEIGDLERQVLLPLETAS